MAKDPAFLFYPSDFLTGVSDLTMEERGQYITLLCLEHQKGRLSKKMIALCCGNAAADVLAKFLIDENGLYFNPRLEVEIEKRKEHSEKQRIRAVEGWKKRKENDATASTTANATALPLEDINENINKDIIKKENKKSEFNFPKSELELCFDKFIEMRKKIKKPPTSHAIDLLKEKIKTLSNGNETLAIEIINQSILNSWQDLFPLRETNKKSNTTENLINSNFKPRFTE